MQDEPVEGENMCLILTGEKIINSFFSSRCTVKYVVEHMKKISSLLPLNFNVSVVFVLFICPHYCYHKERAKYLLWIAACWIPKENPVYAKTNTIEHF